MMKSEDVTIDDLAGLLLHEEARLEQELSQASTQVSVSDKPTPAAFAATRQSSRFGQSPTKPEQNSALQSRSSDQRRRRPQCQLCSKPGHEAINCWHRANQTDYPSRRPPPQRQIHLTQSNSPSTLVDPSWYVDSGATDHVSPDMQRLNIAEDYRGTDKLQVGNGSNSTQRGC